MKPFSEMVVASALLLGACGNADATADHARIIHDQLGRFSAIPAQATFPPMILDTATGCVMALSKDQSGDLTIDEVSFPGGPSSCNAMKQLLVADTAHLVKP